MKILQTVKYYAPSKGGMESVVQDITEGVRELDPNIHFTVYANSHFPTIAKRQVDTSGLSSVKEFTPFIWKSQPLSIVYKSLSTLLKNADVVHHHYPFPNLEIALLRNIELIKNKKLIITWHANVESSRWGWIGKVYHPFTKRLLNRADHIVVTSPQLFENSALLKQFADKVTVIPLSFNPSMVGTPVSELQTGRKFPAQPFKILFVGKLRAYKGIAYLINAICDLNVTLSIVGDGETEDELFSLVNNLNLSDRVSFHKNLSSNELTKLYQESDLFVLPSINEAEAFGVVQLEAMANGLPVINTHLNSGVPFVSVDNVSGITVAPKNCEAIKEAIHKISSDASLYERLSANALQRSKEFSRDQMSKAYLKLYQS